MRLHTCNVRIDGADQIWQAAKAAERSARTLFRGEHQLGLHLARRHGLRMRWCALQGGHISLRCRQACMRRVRCHRVHSAFTQRDAAMLDAEGALQYVLLHSCAQQCSAQQPQGASHSRQACPTTNSRQIGHLQRHHQPFRFR